MMNLYSYSRSELQYNSQLKQTTPKWERYTIDFPTVYQTRYVENNTVWGEYFQPRTVDNAPLVILHHGMGDELLIPCKLLARSLVKKGIACFVMYSVFHSRRAPETIRKRLPNLTPEEWFDGYLISVINIRQVIDWAGSQSEINEEKVAVLGISFGGFISAITMGIDERVKAGVFITSAGNSEKIGQKSRKNSMKKYRHSEAEYHQHQNHYAQYLAEVAEKGIENVVPPRESFLIDPMTFTSYLRQRPVLMLNALWDEYIPRETAVDFWEACGRPSISWYPAAHTTIWLYYPFMSRKIAGFLTSTFGMQNGHAV